MPASFPAPFDFPDRCVGSRSLKVVDRPPFHLFSSIPNGAGCVLSLDAAGSASHHVLNERVPRTRSADKFRPIRLFVLGAERVQPWSTADRNARTLRWNASSSSASTSPSKVVASARVFASRAARRRRL